MPRTRRAIVLLIPTNHYIDISLHDYGLVGCDYAEYMLRINVGTSCEQNKFLIIIQPQRKILFCLNNWQKLA